VRSANLTPTQAVSPRIGYESTAGSEPSLRLHTGLFALCIGGALLESVLVGLLGPRSALPLSPQATATAPYGVFHDLRWLLVYSHSWLTVGLESAGFLLVRGALTAWTVHLAWPHDAARPSVAVLLRRSITFTAAASVLLLFSSSLLVGLAVASVSYLFFTAVPVVLLVALLIHHGPVSPWWHTHPRWRTVGWAALTFVVLTLGGAAIAASPWPLAIVCTGAVGAFNAWAWLGTTRAIALRPSRRFVPIAPVGIVAVSATVVVGAVIAVQLETAVHHIRKPAAPPPTSSASGQPVLVITGFDSHWHGGDDLDLGPGFVQRRFSYAGLDSAGQPRQFHGSDTDRPLPQLVQMMDVQVRTLARQTGQQVDIVSDSEGSLVSKVYLMVHPDAPVRTLVLTSPLVQPGRAYFPRRGSDGYGIAAGYGLRGVSALLRTLTPLDVTPDGQFLRSVADHGPSLRNALGCSLPHTAQLALFPLADAVGAPYDATKNVSAAVLPAFHGKLLEGRSSQHAIGTYLRIGKVPGYGGLRLTERLVRAGAAAWQAPSLRTNLNKVWKADTSGADRGCGAEASKLRAWIG
jgi:hypothetical protein